MLAAGWNRLTSQMKAIPSLRRKSAKSRKKLSTAPGGSTRVGSSPMISAGRRVRARARPPAGAVLPKGR